MSPTITQTFTITKTFTITPTVTITVTAQTTPQYYYSDKDVFFSKTIDITSVDGTYYFYKADYGIPYATILQYIANISSTDGVAYDLELTTTNSYAKISIVDSIGLTVDCSTTTIPVRVDLFILRDKRNFQWW